MKKSFIEIQKEINDLHYWDARVLKLECNHFADEVIFGYEDEDKMVTYEFKECYEVNFNHDKNYDKMRPVSEMTRPQIPYFIQDVEVVEININEVGFYKCKIDLYPLSLEIICKKIIIKK